MLDLAKEHLAVKFYKVRFPSRAHQGVGLY